MWLRPTAHTTMTESSISLKEGGPEIIRIDAKGFHYQGQLIEDAGEAHHLLVDFLRKHRPDDKWQHSNKPSDSELVELYRKSYYECENRQGDAAQVFALRAILARWGK